MSRAGLVAILSLCARPAVADEGGVSFWMPGELGSFAAVPSTPGLSVPVVYLHVSGTVSAERQFRIGGDAVAGLGAGADLAFLVPSYAFARGRWPARPSSSSRRRTARRVGTRG